MAVYLVTWDLNREKPNYAQARALLMARVNRFTHTKDAGLDSARFLSTDWSAQQVFNYVFEALDKNDRLFVTRVASGTHQGWLSQSVWDWINQRL